MDAARPDAGDVDAAAAGDARVDAGDDAGASAGDVTVDFSIGEHAGTRVAADGALELAGAAGTYRTEVIALSAPVPRRLGWTPDGPYAKRFPRDRAAESGYRDDALSMRENVVLYDFPSTASMAGVAVPDLSGRGNLGQVVGSVPAVPVDAPVGSGYGFIDTNWLETPFVNADLQLGASDWTWMTWMRTTQSSEGMVLENRTLFGMEEVGSHDPHIWFGPSHPCNGTAPGAALGGTLRSSAGTDEMSYCGTSVVNDGVWHLVAMTKHGHPTATITVYVDGAPETETMTTFDGPFVFSADAAMGYADFPGSFVTTVDLAHVTIFRRALEALEVLAAHRRGALRVAIQLRACADATCSDDPPFVGPDGTPETVFDDPVDNLSPPVAHDVDLTGAAFVQLEVRMESDRSFESPRIRDLTLQLGP